MKGVTEDNLKQIQMSPKDEFGVTHVNILFNPEADRVFCILDAPDKGAVEKNHKKRHKMRVDYGSLRDSRYLS
jgi:uncharacterized protein DUF4242